MKRRKSCTNVCLLIAGTFQVTLGISIFLSFNYLYDYYINDALRFDEGTEPYRAWKINDPPLILDLYVFNWTNSEDLTTPGVKPKFEEIGPYRFKEVKEKVDLNMTSDRVFYKHRTFYYFDAENSVRQLDDVITTINIVAVSAAYKIRFKNFFVKSATSLLLTGSSSLTMTKTAGEIFFDGFEENFLSFMHQLSVVSGVSQDKFAMFYEKNGTAGADGTFSMWTKNDERFGEVLTWNGANQTNLFEGHCNDVKGSGGEFHPLNRKKDKVTIFSAELCKYADFEFKKETNVKGVKGYKYSGKNIFDNGTLNPENSCFCVGECIPTGVFNVSTCKKDAPIFLSMPHFYGADPYYTDSVEGLHPTDNDELFITLEPKTGVILNIGLKMQVNVLLQPIEHIRMFEYVPKVFFPIFYFSQEVYLKDSIAPRLQLLQKMPDYSNIGVMILITLGLLCFIGLGVKAFCCKKYGSEKYDLPRSDFGNMVLHSKT